MTKKVQYDLILKNGTVVLPNETIKVDVGVKDNQIHTIGNLSECSTECCADNVIDCEGLHVLPGVIDSQVHFREPGLENKETSKNSKCVAIKSGCLSK